MTIEVVNESDVDVDVETLGRQARFVIERLRIHPQAELSVVLVGEEAMTDLHVRWMNEPGPTDVLSFPMDELRRPGDDEEPEPGLLGDVVLCPAVAEQQAAQAGHPMVDELDLLLTHGILHLLGMDHMVDDEAAEMEAREQVGIKGGHLMALGRWPKGPRKGEMVMMIETLVLQDEQPIGLAVNYIALGEDQPTVKQRDANAAFQQLAMLQHADVERIAGPRAERGRKRQFRDGASHA